MILGSKYTRFLAQAILEFFDPGLTRKPRIWMIQPSFWAGKVQDFCMLCVMQTHISMAFSNSGGIIKPTLVINDLRRISKHFSYGSQEDAHEFLRYTVDEMQRSCLNGSFRFDRHTQATTLIHRVFGGYLRSRVTCLNCKAVSDTYDQYLDITLEIKMAHSVNQALEQFVRPEQLDGDNAYKCSKCKQMVAASKRFTIHRSSNVLTLSLKRFASFSGGKLSKEIKYPEYLDIRPYTSEPNGEPIIYVLYAVLIHNGFSCHGGHYYCYVRACNNQWYLMNDSTVTSADIRSVLNQQAYLLFYVRSQSAQNGTASYFLHATSASSPQPSCSQRANNTKSALAGPPRKLKNSKHINGKKAPKNLMNNSTVNSNNVNLKRPPLGTTTVNRQTLVSMPNNKKQKITISINKYNQQGMSLPMIHNTESIHKPTASSSVSKHSDKQSTSNVSMSLVQKQSPREGYAEPAVNGICKTASSLLVPYGADSSDNSEEEIKGQDNWDFKSTNGDYNNSPISPKDKSFIFNKARNENEDSLAASVDSWNGINVSDTKHDLNTPDKDAYSGKNPPGPCSPRKTTKLPADDTISSQGSKEKVLWLTTPKQPYQDTSVERNQKHNIIDWTNATETPAKQPIESPTAKDFQSSNVKRQSSRQESHLQKCHNSCDGHNLSQDTGICESIHINTTVEREQEKKPFDTGFIKSYGLSPLLSDSALKITAGFIAVSKNNHSNETIPDVKSFENTLDDNNKILKENPDQARKEKSHPVFLDTKRIKRDHIRSERCRSGSSEHAKEKHPTSYRERKSHSRERTKSDRYRNSHSNEYKHKDYSRRNSPYNYKDCNKHRQNRERSRSRGRYDHNYKSWYGNSKRPRSRSRERKYHERSRLYNHKNYDYDSHGYRSSRDKRYEDRDHHSKFYNCYRNGGPYYRGDKVCDTFYSPKYNGYCTLSFPRHSEKSNRDKCNGMVNYHQSDKYTKKRRITNSYSEDSDYEPEYKQRNSTDIEKSKEYYRVHEDKRIFKSSETSISPKLTRKSSL
ncbi:hypothetical protein GDO86_017390 [Hymenochirus boettgeri]|uniref:USP domain-containing protein n=1 Tax=Hymenochirus boettgeri TaxID=247094 RepID=A0A8T2ISD2_9PIPI|nr:hypothetical protein GDO86_017390 [Hymenochirus boettgeri]